MSPTAPAWAPPDAPGDTGAKPGLFTPLTVRDVTLPNRIVMSPMCMYSAEDGLVGPWHGVHLASRAAGGVGLVIVEATAVSPEGRITPGDVGLWADRHAAALAPVTRLIREHGAVPGIQLAHAGRKGGRTIPWQGNAPIAQTEWGPLLAPTARPFRADWNTPVEMDEVAIRTLVTHFANAARRAASAGFDVVELHAAHGYLLHQFLSPLSNHRTDAYGGGVEARSALLVEVVRAVRAAIGEERALFVRLPLVDWVADGITLEDTVVTAQLLAEEGVDLIDCSSGANVPEETVPAAPLYHVPMTRELRARARVRTGAVGLITTPAQAEEVIRSESADLVLLGRALLHNAYWPRRAAEELEQDNPNAVPRPYRRAVERMREQTQW